MRQLRNFKTNHCYHLISRIANRAFFLTDDERTRFVDRMWRVARFSGVEILAYCFMSNHFHLLVYLPGTTVLSDAELMDRVAALYSDSRLAEIRKEWETYCAANDAARMDAFRQRFLRRMFDISAFMKTLKQNSTMSYNSRRVHTGTMWESRFRVREYRSDEKTALMNVAGYIDRIEWDQIRVLHEKSIHLALKELDDETLKGPARIGLSVDEEKSEKVCCEFYREVEASIPDCVPLHHFYSTIRVLSNQILVDYPTVQSD